MTYRELGFMLQAMTSRKNSEAKFQAAIHGVELKGQEKEDEIRTREVTPEEQAKMDEALKQIMFRKKLEHNG